MKPEERVKRRIKDILKSFGPDLYYFMPRGTAMGTAGVPDFIVCFKGRMIGVEAKATTKNKPTGIQSLNHEKIRRAGGLAIVIHDENIEELTELLGSL